MMQIELYIRDVHKTAQAFITLGYTVTEEKKGWRKLSRGNANEVMLFNPLEIENGISHWTIPEAGQGGSGIEIVFIIQDIFEKRNALIQLGYNCTAIRTTPWNTQEFTFKLEEGYLLRIKERQ